MYKGAFYFTVLFVLASYLPAYAQKNVSHQNLLWMRYFLRVRLNETWQVRQELEERTYWFPWRQHHILARTMAERKIGEGWSVSAGFAGFLQSLPQDPKVRDYTIQAELRPIIELSYRHGLSEKFSLQHRYLTEFRFIEESDGGFEYTNNRTRYRAEIRYQASPTVALTAFDEVFLNIGSNIVGNVFDQNRYGASILYMPGPRFGFELGYFNWFQQRPTGIDFYNRNIIRFTLHHSIIIKPRKS